MNDKIQHISTSKPTTYRFDSENHIHLINDRPAHGVSTVCGVISKPLSWWASGMCAAEFGWRNPKKTPAIEVSRAIKEGFDMVKNLNEKEYGRLLTRAYRAHHEHKKDTAEEGKDYHSLIEIYIRSKILNLPIPVDPEISFFVEWAESNVKNFLFAEAHCYSEKLWCGGICDFGFINKQGRYAIGDIKRSGPYYSHLVQVGGYDVLIEENGVFTSDGKVLIPVLPVAEHYTIFPSKGKPLTISGDAIIALRHSFMGALKLYQGQQWFEKLGSK